MRVRGTDPTPFQTMANEISDELGLRLENILLQPSDRVKYDSVVIRINHRRSTPRKCLGPNQILVDAAPENVRNILGLGPDEVSPFPVLNPATDGLCCVTNVKHEQSLEQAGLKFYQALGYLILHLKRELTRNAWRVLDCESVEIELARLHKELPALVLAALDRQSPLMLTRILRILLREEISIKNLRTILERIRLDAQRQSARMF